MSQSNVSRRDFIQKAALLTGAGLAAGGVVAVGKEVWDFSAQSTTAEVETLQAQVAESSTQLVQLQTSLAAAESELAKLRPDYAAVLSTNAALQNSLTGKQQEVDSLKSALAGTQAQMEKLTALTGMYGRLDNNTFDSLVNDGLAAASAGLVGAVSLTPLVVDGMRLARTLFEGFEGQFPNFRSGLTWLRDRLNDLSNSILTVEKAILQALKTLDPVTATMSQLVSHILNYLPANIGLGVRAALDAINFLYQSLPNVINGAHDQVIDMLSEPFGESEKSWGRTLVGPIRDRSIAPAEKLAVQVKTFGDTFNRSLHDPVKQALDQRAAVLKEIADFRTANNL
jgi:hypothetical protein